MYSVTVSFNFSKVWTYVDNIFLILTYTKKVSISPLSIHRAILDILWVISVLSNIILKILDVYWNYLSLWKIGLAFGYLEWASLKFLNTNSFLLELPKAKETILLSAKSIMALKETLLWVPYLSSVTLVSHFSPKRLDVNSLFKIFSAVICGVDFI